MYVNFGIMMGSWHTTELDEESTINALGILRIAPTRDVPSALVVTGLFDAYVDQFRSALNTCDRSRFKPLLDNYKSDNFIRVAYMEVYTYHEADAPELIDLRSLDNLHDYHRVQHLRFTNTGGGTVEELALGAARI